MTKTSQRLYLSWNLYAQAELITVKHCSKKNLSVFMVSLFLRQIWRFIEGDLLQEKLAQICS